MKSKKKACLTLCLALLAAMPCAAEDNGSPGAAPQATAETAGIAQHEIQLPVKEHTLSNGLTVLLLPRHHSPTVACQIAFKVGSNNERPGVTGSAHMLEHMMFKGTKVISTRNYEAEVPIMEKIDQVADQLLKEMQKGDSADQTRVKELKAELDRLQDEQRQYVIPEEMANLYKAAGGSGINAYTADDYTNYIIRLPSDKVELWCWLESDRIANPVFREFYSEKEVVHEERRMRADNDPSGALWEVFISTAYMAHPYQWMVIGWPSDIANYRRETMQEFFTRYYAPNNAVIVWVGDFEEESALAMIRRYFEPIPSQEMPPPVTTVEPEQKGERRAVLEYDANPSLAMGWHTVSVHHADQAPLEALQAILSEGRTSRLYKKMREQKQMVSEIGAYQDRSEYPGLFAIYADPIQGVSCELVEKEILAEVEKLGKEGVSDWELQKVKNQMKADYVIALESNYELARNLAEYECKHDWPLYLDAAKRRDAVTADDIKRVVNKYLIESNRTVTTLKTTSKKASS